MADSFSSAPLSVIETCWPIIEPYLDLESSVAISQIRALRRAIVDLDSNKLKVSHFAVDSSPSQSPYEPLAKNWHTAPARIPHFLSHSLNCIHFPSLRRLYLDFPPTKRRSSSGHHDIIDDACNTSFPIFATNLSLARNLEYLHLNAGRLMAIERSGSLDALYEIFAANLLNCRKLKHLDVCNSGAVRGISDPVYSVALMRALTPTIQNGKLETLRLSIAGTASDPLYERSLSSKGIHAVPDFFEEALSIRDLRVFDISMSRCIYHLNALVGTAMHLLSAAAIGGTKPSSIVDLRMRYLAEGEDFHRMRPDSAASLLEYFSECHSLETIFLELPPQCWDGEEIINSLRRLLKNKPCLSSLTISFSRFQDRSGNMMKIISECLAPNISSRVLRKLCIFGLMGIDEPDVTRLQLSLQSAGMVCDLFRAIKRNEAKLDIMIMKNRQMLKGEVQLTPDAFEDAVYMH